MKGSAFNKNIFIELCLKLQEEIAGPCWYSAFQRNNYICTNSGVNIFVTDLLNDSAAKRIADKSFIVSTTGVDFLAKIIEDGNIDGVFNSYTDLLLPYNQLVCKKTNKPC